MNTEEALEIVGEPWPRTGKLHCPGHDDRTPSLQLYEDSFYCFSCGRNGDSYGLMALLSDKPVAEILRLYGGPRSEKPKLAKKVSEREMRQELQTRLVTLTQPMFDAIRNTQSARAWARDLLIDEASDLYDRYRMTLREASPYEAEMLLRQVPGLVAGFIESRSLDAPPPPRMERVVETLADETVKHLVKEARKQGLIPQQKDV